MTYLFPEKYNNRRLLYSVDCNVNDGKYSKIKMIDTSSVSGKLSLEEQLRRERMRLFADGIVSYEWTGNDSSNQKVMVPFNGQVLQFESQNGAESGFDTLYDASEGPCIDPHMSPDGNTVAFVMQDNLWIQMLNDKDDKTFKPIRLTDNGLKPGIQCGGADYIAQEEMDRYRGYWWSPDSKFIAYTETDENSVQEYQILHQGKADPKHSETHRYPFAGENNPIVKLAVLAVPTEGSCNADKKPDHVWMNLVESADHGIDPEDYYLGRVGWWSDGSVMAQVQNRDQGILQLLRLDPLTGEKTILIEEKSNVWINLHDMLYDLPSSWAPLGNDNRNDGDLYFFWASERSGFCQLYLYHYSASTGKCEPLHNGRPIGGGGEFVIENINTVDIANNIIYFSGNKDSPTEKHLYRTSFAETSTMIERLTTEAGWHQVAVSVTLGIFADIYSSPTSPPTLSLFSLPKDSSSNSTLLTELLDKSFCHTSASKESLVPTLVPPTIECFKSKDGEVDLYCAVYKPDSSFGPGPFPCILLPYGGPHVMRVLSNWMCTADLRAQRFAKSGFVVLKVDNRGSYRRGIQFEGALKNDMGNVEVLDQVAAVEYFVDRGLVNPERVGMHGWSYGGYMSAMSLCRAPETFCCAIAGAPVTSWDGYDTHYTERYMSTPQANPEGYEASSVMTHVANMKGRLMLVHGLIDENVHFRHTARLINRLIEERKIYDLVLFPCERHSPHKEQDRVYLEDRMFDFFVEQLCRSVPSQNQFVLEGTTPGLAKSTSTSTTSRL